MGPPGRANWALGPTTGHSAGSTFDQVKALRRRDDGQSTIEWLGIAAVCVALIVALLTLAPGMGRQIADTLGCLIVQVTGGGPCGRADVADGGPTTPCVVSASKTQAELGGDIAVVSVDGTYGYIIEEMSDGTVKVTEVLRGEASGATGVGGGIVVNAGDQRVGGAAGAGARAGGFIELGDAWIFPDRDEADEHIENTLVDRALDTNPVTGMPGINHIAKGALGLIGVGGNDVEGERESTRVDVGILGDATAEAVAGVASGEVTAGLEGAAGLTMHQDGTVDATFIVSADAAGSLGVPALADLDLGASGTAEVTVTFAPDGSIDSVGLTATGTATNDSGVGDQDPAAALEDLTQSVVDPQDATTQVVLDYELDIDSPELEDAAVGFITSMAPGGTAAGDGASTLGDALINDSTVTRSVYDLDDGKYGIDASGKFIVGGRLSANLVRENSRLVDATYYDPVSGSFVPWINCTG